MEWLLGCGYKPGRVREDFPKAHTKVRGCQGLGVQAACLCSSVALLFGALLPSAMGCALSPVQGVDLSGAGLVSRLSWLRDRGFALGPEVARYVVAAGDDPAAVSVLIDAATQQQQDLSYTAEDVALAAAREACRQGRFACLQLLLDRGWLKPWRIRLSILLMNASVLKPRLDVASWLVEHLTGPAAGANEQPMTGNVFVEAAVFGSVPLLQRMQELGAPKDVLSWELAAEGGCEEVLDYLRRQRVPKPVSGRLVRASFARTAA